MNISGWVKSGFIFVASDNDYYVNGQSVSIAELEQAIKDNFGVEIKFSDSKPSPETVIAALYEAGKQSLLEDIK